MRVTVPQKRNRDRKLLQIENVTQKGQGSHVENSQLRTFIELAKLALRQMGFLD